MNENKQWPEDQADWPQTASVVQGGVVPAKPTHTYGKTRAVNQEPFSYFRAELFGWVDCGEKNEGAVALYDQETVNALQGRCDELLSAAKAVIERWDSPQWKDLPPTVDVIARLRDAVNKLEGGAA